MAIPDGLVEDDFRCGTMTALLDRSDPAGPVVQLEVAVLGARNGSPEPDPLLFFGGGPGAASLDTYIPTMATSALAAINERRDIVFIDARGAGRSTPSLACPEYDAAFVESFTVDGTPEEDADALVDGYLACRARLDGEGVPTSHHHSAAIVEDAVETLDALGYDGPVNVYGISYGARYALVLLREHPDRVRSAILDSPVTPEADIVGSGPSSFETSLAALFATCARSTTCSAEYPTLEDDVFAAAAMLDESPATVDVMVDGESTSVVINGHRILAGLYAVLYVPELAQLIPQAVQGILAGSPLVINALAPGLVEGERTGSAGHYASVYAAEELPFITADSVAMLQTGVRSELVAAVAPQNADVLLALQEGWPVEARPPVSKEPVTSDVPTLLLSGELDPGTPAMWAADAVARLSNGQHLIFPGYGHGVLRDTLPDEPADDTCGRRIAAAFIDAPMESVDASCVDTLPPLL